jgi:DNA-binding MarR family transcriptional regulator
MTSMPRPEDAEQVRLYAMAAELRGVLGALRRKLREQSHIGDFTESQISVLRLLERGPGTVSALARAEGVRPQSMGATIAALEAVGLVAGTPDPADGRQRLWALTPSCRERVKASRAAREDWLFRVIRKNLSGPEQRELSQAIELLKRLVS